MNRHLLRETLTTKDPAVLLELLVAAYDAMTTDQRQAVFGRIAGTLPATPEVQPPAQEDGESLLARIVLFHQQSYAGAYFASFRIDSKNYMHIPEKTKQWFALLGEYLEASGRLTAQGDHLHALACFDLLYELIESIDKGEEIVFADELGSWMIPVSETDFQNAYLTSLAATASAEEFSKKAIHLIRRDRLHSFAHAAYATALRVASAEQRTFLKAAVQREKIETRRSR